MKEDMKFVFSKLCLTLLSFDMKITVSEKNESKKRINAKGKQENIS